MKLTITSGKRTIERDATPEEIMNLAALGNEEAVAELDAQATAEGKLGKAHFPRSLRAAQYQKPEEPAKVEEPAPEPVAPPAPEPAPEPAVEPKAKAAPMTRAQRVAAKAAKTRG